MPQISKVEREHDIKQVSRLDDLKPATEKTVSKAIPQIRGKPEMQDTSQALTSSMNAAKQASIAAIRHAKTISDSSDKSEDQEAIEKMEASVRNAAADSANAALGAKDALKRQIKKKSPDIKNTKDIKNGTRSIRKADRAIKSATEASQIAAKTANQAAKEAAITSTKVATTRKAERLAKKSAEWVKKIVKGIVDAIKRLCAALGAASVPLMLILVLAAAMRTKKISWPAVIVWGVGTVFTFFFIMSPGNFIRYSEEILFWFPNFGLLSSADKLFLGISYTLRYCLTDLFLPVFMTAVGTFVIICLRKNSVILKATAFLPVAYYGLYHIYKVPILYDYAFPDSVQGFTASNWIAVFFGIFQ